MNSISGSVYIWYPKDENVGHCSLQIGDRNYPEHYKNARPGLFTTPRDIAVMLNQLARKGDVEKVVSPSCPKRTRSFMYVCLKMR